MNFFILLVAQVLLVVQNEAAVPPPPVCLTGIAVNVGSVPVPIIKCGANQIWGCGYCDAACFKQFCCGTPPCRYGYDFYFTL